MTAPQLLVLVAILLAAAALDFAFFRLLLSWRSSKRPNPLVPLISLLRGLVVRGKSILARGRSEARRAGREFFTTSVESLRELRRDELASLRGFLVLACILINASLGYIYSDLVSILGWQMVLWLVCTAVALFALLPWSKPPIQFRKTDWLLLGLVVTAGILRAIWLDRIPPGLHTDESGTVSFTWRFILPRVDATLAPWRMGPNSQPVLYYYLPWLGMKLLGWTPVGLRITSALAGSLAVLATFGVVSTFHNRRAAWIAAAILTTYHYHIHWSRLGLNNIWDTLWVPAILACFGWGWKTRWRGGAAFAGLALGFSQYFYAGNKISFVLLAYLVVVFWRKEANPRELIRYVWTMVAMFLVAAVPLMMFTVLHPELVVDRFLTVFAWTPQNLAIDVPEGALWPNAFLQAVRALTGLTSLPDTSGFYGPGVPLVIGLAAPLFVAGLLRSAFRGPFLPVMWVATTVFLGGFLLRSTPASSHYIAVIPAVTWLIADPIERLLALARGRLAIALLILVMAVDLGFYFGVYVPAGSHRDLSASFPDLPPP